MTLGTEIGETSYNMLTIYPIQSIHCGKGLLMMNTLCPYSRRSLNWRNCCTLPAEISRLLYMYFLLASNILGGHSGPF